MTHQFALSPDVNVRNLSHWFVFNTRLQKLADQSLHLTAFDDFGELHRAIEREEVDLVFANSADTALLVRERGFAPLASPQGVSDEAMIVVSTEGGARSLADLAGGPLSVAAADAPDVDRICRILLEPVDVVREDVQITRKRNPVLVAKAVISGEARAGFLLAAAFSELSEATRRLLRPVASSHIYVVRHSLLVGPRLAAVHGQLLAALDLISANEGDRSMLEGLGAPAGWSPMSREDAEFLIDLMDTLQG